jgi:hypothetical protein
MELQDLDKYCLELLELIPSKQSRHCFRSAINHLERAETLFPIDSSMAVFRCYTAEEEAASGLIYCLKDKGYKNAEKLNPRNHVQKNAVIQFFSILCQFVEDSFREFEIDTFLSVVQSNEERKLVFGANMDLGNGTTKFIPEPPLNFKLIHEEKRFSYKEQINGLVESKAVKEIGEHLKNVANQRNLLLYASQQGYPADIEIEDKFFPAYQNRVLTLLRTYLMIEPYRGDQFFVQDALDAFLAMLEKQNFDDLHDEF